MAKIVLGIAALFMLATAFLGFQTKTKIEGIRNERETAQASLRTSQAKFVTMQGDLKSAQDQASEAGKKADAAAAEAAQARGELDKARADVTENKTKLEDAAKQVAALQAELAAKQGSASPTTAGPTPEEIAKMQADLKEAQAKVAELNQVNSTLKSRADEAEGRAKTLTAAEERRKQHLVQPGLEGQILAVNPGWNFVVLSIGDRQGAVANAEMLIMRGSERVGKAKITSVEPATSVADIVPGSLARGVRVQPGDRVIFAGQ